MNDLATACRHYDIVARAIVHLRRHARSQPTLAELAAVVGLSPAHLQRVFAEWAGISPKRFVQHLTREYARSRLRAAADTLSVALDAGLSGNGRLHDLMIVGEAMTPGEIQRGGEGVTLDCGSGPTPFGMAFLAWNERGICHLSFVHDDGAASLATLAEEWPRAALRRSDEGAAAMLQRIFGELVSGVPLHLQLRGSNFQLKVWEALIRVPPGEVLSYGQLAGRLGAPRAQRAVGSALAANDIGFLIPCHRVIRDSGESGNYRWGEERKLALQLWEAGRRAPDAAA